MADAGRWRWRCVVGWLTRLILILFVILEAVIWLDVLLQPEEYERLIGSEAACGKFKSYCSWRAYVLDNVPFMVLSVLAIAALLWRKLPRREATLEVLAICLYLVWRVHSVQLEAAMAG